MMNDVPEMETERLTLKFITLLDANDVFAYASNPNVLKQTTAETPRMLCETREFVRSLIDSPSDSFAWAIRLKGDVRVVGVIEFDLRNRHTGSTHCALAEDCWNKGLMTEACRAVTAWAFQMHLELDTVQTDALESNMGSRRVLEKSGFEFQGFRDDMWEKLTAPVHLAIYAISRQKWELTQD